MDSSISAQMLTAYRRTKSRGNQVRKLHEKEPAFSDIDSLEFDARNRFFLGVHHALSKEIVDWLTRNVGAQQQIADALGLKDRTSISKMLHSGSMDGVRITAAAYQFGLRITGQTRERAAFSGFARAASFIKARVYKSDSIEGTMSPLDFASLIRMFADDDWCDAIRNPNPMVAREVALRIVNESALAVGERNTNIKYRPEQCVMILKDVEDTWADYGAVALWLLPDCIPTVEPGKEAVV